MELTKVTKKQLLWFVIAWVLYAVILLIPIADLEPAGHRALAALAWIVVILISNCIPVLLSTMIFAVMIILSGVLSQGALLAVSGAGRRRPGHDPHQSGRANRIPHFPLPWKNPVPDGIGHHADSLYHLRADCEPARASGGLSHCTERSEGAEGNPW